MGARERLALELRERKAPLALMESLSDVDSLYSMDSRRSSAALRGSPCLGTLAFSLDAPIPEENPSLSSRTELIQASPERELSGQTGPYCATPPEEAPPTQSQNQPIAGAPRGQQGALPKTNSGTFYRSSGGNSREVSPAVPWAGLIDNAESEGSEKDESVEKQVKAAAALSNGKPSQAVLEFAQYLDSLFQLDGADALALESDGESESGRGSSVRTEGQGLDEMDGERRLLVRATVEPNLVPKPPRTFAGSAEPSSGVSPSPSFPLSLSSGEMNDLSPLHHAPLRTPAASPYAEENAMPSVV